MEIVNFINQNVELKILITSVITVVLSYLANLLPQIKTGKAKSIVSLVVSVLTNVGLSVTQFQTVLPTGADITNLIISIVSALGLSTVGSKGIYDTIHNAIKKLKSKLQSSTEQPKINSNTDLYGNVIPVEKHNIK